ncbi:outer membrane beta-barrel protein [Persicobacter psychrovividus]|uniref:Outer membrane protein beta-barrel domain-containing protein n=1 Tax=Persicobacter psychrovividus TaxID=387638 RepID=A0ABN6L624_9BACT|nr:hypothetical protein PEPS_09160 [Persicobacter psychrovividus]
MRRKLLDLFGTLIVCFMLLTSFQAQAQRINIKAGAVLGNSLLIDSDQLRTFTDSRLGPMLGVGFEQQFFSFMIWNVSVDYQSQGYHVYYQNIKQTYAMNVINIPLNYGFRVEVADGMAVSIYGGLYGQIHLNGTDTEGNKLVWGGQEGHIEPWDMGVNVTGGFDMGPIRLALSYQNGMRDLNHVEGETFKQYNIQFSLSYYFGMPQRDGLPKVLRSKPGKNRNRDWTKPNPRKRNQKMHF